MTTDTIPDASSTMEEVLKSYPGARRALFRRYHIGGCRSCAFSPSETLKALCERNGNLPVEEVLAHIQESHLQDEALWVKPTEVTAMDPRPLLLDVRTREEFEAVHIPGSTLMNQDIMREAMERWDRDKAFIIVDHLGAQALDAAAYFLGHGFQSVRCLLGGIDGWSQEVDGSLPRYTFES